MMEENCRMELFSRYEVSVLVINLYVSLYEVIMKMVRISKVLLWFVGCVGLYVVLGCGVDML